MKDFLVSSDRLKILERRQLHDRKLFQRCFAYALNVGVNAHPHCPLLVIARFSGLSFVGNLEYRTVGRQLTQCCTLR